MGAATDDAWAAFGNFMANAMMRRAEAKDEDERYAIRAELQEKALEQREIARENRAAKKAVGRSDAYHTPGAFGADYRVDKLNAAGDVVGMERANPREKQGYQDRITQATEAKRIADEEAKIKAEDRTLDRADKNKRTSIAERNAAAAELRASRTGLSEEKPEKPLSRNEALKALSSFRYRAQEGESARDVARRDGVDYDSLLEAANRGVEKKPGVIERVGNAVGGAISSIADKFVPKEGKSIMAQREPGKKSVKPNEDTPPEPGARKAPDGFWYVQEGGKWVRLEK